MQKSVQITLDQRFHVDFNYPVVFGRGFFHVENPGMMQVLDRVNPERRHRVLVVLDAGVENAFPALTAEIGQFFAAQPQAEQVCEPLVLPGGERLKNDYRQIMQLIDLMLEHRMCRQSYVIAVGGGAFLDAVGFAVSLVHRGLRLIRMPTTVLGQNDAGIGVKNAMNLHGGKNTIGVFAPPFAVINDFNFLTSLPPREWTGGIAEAFKVSIIKDPTFFRELCAMAPRLKARDMEAMEHLIVECARLHLDHIAHNGDPFEMGSARPLDFGHWAAHKLEAMTNYSLSHGEAVAIGIALDSLIARENGWLNDEELEAIHRGLAESGFQLWHPAMDRELGDGSLEILGGLRDFQEHLGGELCVTMPQGIGAKFEIHEMDDAHVVHAVQSLRARFSLS